MRGKVKQKKKSIKFNGITPAYAGKSRLQRQNVVEQGGSPPPMRGKDIKKGPDRSCQRITPAYAGKSFFADFRSNLSWDHPRLCGEKFASYGTSIAPTGSPPPMRGKVFFQPLAKSLGGITPAYAGKSEFCPKSSRSGQDHPRLCGEK